jgi:hypothetical protein
MTNTFLSPTPTRYLWGLVRLLAGNNLHFKEVLVRRVRLNVKDPGIDLVIDSPGAYVISDGIILYRSACMNLALGLIAGTSALPRATVDFNCPPGDVHRTWQVFQWPDMDSARICHTRTQLL